MAFIDWDYQSSGLTKCLTRRFMKFCPPEWQKMSHAVEKDHGGFYFSWLFGATPGPPLRLLCPSTYSKRPKLTVLTIEGGIGVHL